MKFGALLVPKQRTLKPKRKPKDGATLGHGRPLMQTRSCVSRIWSADVTQVGRTRRFTRLTNGFSKKVQNHCHAVALYFVYYNFGRVHQTLRVTPCMEAGLTDHVWSIEEICNLVAPKKAVSRVRETEKEMLLKALSRENVKA